MKIDKMKRKLRKKMDRCKGDVEQYARLMQDYLCLCIWEEIPAKNESITISADKYFVFEVD